MSERLSDESVNAIAGMRAFTLHERQDVALARELQFARRVVEALDTYARCGAPWMAVDDAMNAYRETMKAGAGDCTKPPEQAGKLAEGDAPATPHNQRPSASPAPAPSPPPGLTPEERAHAIRESWHNSRDMTLSEALVIGIRAAEQAALSAQFCRVAALEAEVARLRKLAGAAWELTDHGAWRKLRVEVEAYRDHLDARAAAGGA